MKLHQNEVQSAYFSKQQATVHPISAYYQEDGVLKIISWVGISDNLTHSTVTVHCFQKKFFEFVFKGAADGKFPYPTKIYYFTDGCAGQYKNKKNFMNLLYHEIDFQVPAEWNFFGTAHGKSPSDGLGGNVKRMARVESLRNDTAIIRNPVELFEFLKKKTSKIHIDYVSNSFIESEEKLQNERFVRLLTVKGTKQFHCFMPCPNQPNTIIAKHFSESLNETKHCLQK